MTKNEGLEDFQKISGKISGLFSRDHLLAHNAI
jgi:hypothetical protein